MCHFTSKRLRVLPFLDISLEKGKANPPKKRIVIPTEPKHLWKGGENAQRNQGIPHREKRHWTQKMHGFRAPFRAPFCHIAFSRICLSQQAELSETPSAAKNGVAAGFPGERWQRDLQVEEGGKANK